jgi:hypothetical protein
MQANLPKGGKASADQDSAHLNTLIHHIVICFFGAEHRVNMLKVAGQLSPDVDKRCKNLVS